MGVLTALVVGAGAHWLAGDPALAGAVGLVYGVAVGVAARWEPVARRRGLWGEDGMAGRDGGLIAGGVVALSFGTALVGVHDGLGLPAETQLLVRLLVVGVAVAGLYLGVAAVVLARAADERSTPTPASTEDAG